jgi:hypothetical protein
MLTNIADDLSPRSAHDPMPAGCDVSKITLAKDPAAPVAKRTDITTALVFQVDSVEKTEAPGGGQGQDWYRYVLKNNSSTINGLRRGSHQHVCDYAADYAEQLNSRIVFGPPHWNPRGTKAARTT